MVTPAGSRKPLGHCVPPRAHPCPGRRVPLPPRGKGMHRLCSAAGAAGENLLQQNPCSCRATGAEKHRVPGVEGGGPYRPQATRINLIFSWLSPSLLPRLTGKKGCTRGRHWTEGRVERLPATAQNLLLHSWSPHGEPQHPLRALAVQGWSSGTGILVPCSRLRGEANP